MCNVMYDFSNDFIHTYIECVRSRMISAMILYVGILNALNTPINLLCLCYLSHVGPFSCILGVNYTE